MPAEAARAMVPEGDFEVVESHPGVAHLIITAHDYIRGEWGACETLDLGFRVRPAGAPDETSGLFLCPAPMRQGFSREAAHRAHRLCIRIGTTCFSCIGQSLLICFALSFGLRWN